MIIDINQFIISYKNLPRSNSIYIFCYYLNIFREIRILIFKFMKKSNTSDRNLNLFYKNLK